MDREFTPLLRQSLSDQIKMQDEHAIMFVGPSGTGKTTTCTLKQLYLDMLQNTKTLFVLMLSWSQKPNLIDKDVRIHR